MPTTIAEAERLRHWAVTTAPALPPPASQEQLTRHLEFMHAALPSQQKDAETGRKRAAVYASLLAGNSDEALAFMARTACATLDWFPTPRQCLDLLAKYQRPPAPQTEALRLCQQFTQAQFEGWLERVRGGDHVGDAPPQWLRIAVERDVLRQMDNGTYVSRALYNGPPRRAAMERKP